MLLVPDRGVDRDRSGMAFFAGFSKGSIAEFYDKLEKDDGGRGFGIEDGTHGGLSRIENGMSGKGGKN